MTFFNGLPKWALILVGLAGLVAACDEQPIPSQKQPPGSLPDQILTDFTVEMSEGAVTSVRIEASRGVVYRKRDSMVIVDLLANLYDAQGKHTSVLTADSGLLRERKKRLLAHGGVNLKTVDSLLLTSDSLFWYGDLSASAGRLSVDSSRSDRYMVAVSNVHLITRDSVHLWTDTLRWDDVHRTVATDAYIVIVRNQHDTLQGWGLRSDDQLEVITIQESVKGRMKDRSP
jgi:hypothetical protein